MKGWYPELTDFSYFLGFFADGLLNHTADRWRCHFLPPGQRDAQADGTAGRAPEADAGEMSTKRNGTIRRSARLIASHGVAFPLCVRNAPSGSPRSPPTPSWRWTRRRTWASSSPTWWTWCTPGPTAPPLRKSARWRTCLKVRGRRFRFPAGVGDSRRLHGNKWFSPTGRVWISNSAVVISWAVSRRPTDCKFNQPTSLIKVRPPS